MAIIFATIFLCIVGYAIKNYNEGKKHIGVLVYFFFVSHGFYLIPDNVLGGLPINKLIDFGTLYLIYVFLHKIATGTPFKRYLVHHSETKCFYILFIYVTGLFLWTIITGREQIILSLAVYRKLFRFLSFIIFIDLSIDQLKWVFKRVFFITTIACILYVSQPIIGIKILTGGEVGEVNYTGLARYRNIPYLAYFFLIYATIRLNFSDGKSIFLVLLFIISLVLTQHRGIMIGYVVSIATYLLVEHKVKKIVQFSVIGGLIFITVGGFVLSRFEKSNTSDDFKALQNLDYRKVYFEDDNEGGTLTFRVLLLLERMDFLVHNPQYALQGVGMRHEDSPKTTKDFSFFVCSRKKVNNRSYYQQLDTGDLVWATPLMKFGFVGLGFYIVIMCCMLRFFYKNRKLSSIANISLYYYILLIITSFKNDQLFDAIHLFMLFLVYHIIQKQRQLNHISS